MAFNIDQSLRISLLVLKSASEQDNLTKRDLLLEIADRWIGITLGALNIMDLKNHNQKLKDGLYAEIGK
jgi:hypothetical protein